MTKDGSNANGPSNWATMLLARLGLLFGALVVTLVAGALLVLAARSQMRLQSAPTDLKYAPARATPPPARSATPRSALDDVDSSEPAAPSVAVNPATGVPDLGGPAYPQFPVAPAYTDPSQHPMPRPDVRPLTPSAPAAPPATAHTAPPARPSAAPPVPAPAARFRRVGDKTFASDDKGFLVDTTYGATANLPVVEVVAGGPDYARVLEEHRELAQFFRLSDRLIVVSDGTVYRVVPGR